VRRDFVVAYVEKLLREVGGSDRVVTDADGDYPVRYGSALYYVRVIGEARADVQVFAIAVDGANASAELIADINDVNTEVRFARVFYVRDQVLVEADLDGESIQPSSFYTACNTVASITDRIGPDLAARHGGKTAFEDSKDAGYQSSASSVGMYL
jgi:hypothetical protein